MQKFTRPVLILVISLLLVFISVAFKTMNPTLASAQPNVRAIQATQVTATAETPEREDHSVIGSTDSITLMSLIIVAIIIAPIIIKRQSWSQD